MNKKLLYYFLTSIILITVYISCKKQDRFPGQTLPGIIKVNPTSAIPGASVKIKGANLGSVTAIRFGTIASLFSVESDSVINAIVPDSIAAGILYVQVYVGDGIAYAAQQFTILEAPKIPAITGFDTSIAFPGGNIVITGKNFTAVSTVLFGSVAALYTISDSTKLNVSVPDDLTDSNVLITVASPSGSDTASFKINLAPVITSFTPVKAHRGDLVTVNGKRFTGASSVLLGRLSSSYTVINDTSLNLTIPANAVTGLVTVATPNGVAASSDSLQIY